MCPELSKLVQLDRHSSEKESTSVLLGRDRSSFHSLKAPVFDSQLLSFAFLFLSPIDVIHHPRM